MMLRAGRGIIKWRHQAPPLPNTVRCRASAAAAATVVAVAAPVPPSSPSPSSPPPLAASPPLSPPHRVQSTVRTAWKRVAGARDGRSPRLRSTWSAFAMRPLTTCSRCSTAIFLACRRTTRFCCPPPCGPPHADTTRLTLCTRLLRTDEVLLLPHPFVAAAPGARSLHPHAA